MPLPKVETRTDDERLKHNIRMKRYYLNHPEQRDKIKSKLNEKYATDESYRLLVKERVKNWRQMKKVSAVTDNLP